MIIGVPIIFYYRGSDVFFRTFLLDGLPFFSLGFLLFLIPHIMIHMRYYTINEGMEMEYDDIENKIIIKDTKKDKVAEFSIDDIQNVIHRMTSPFAEKRMEWFPWDSYNFSNIILKTGEKFTITSLMVYRLELPVEEKYLIIKTLYPYP